MKYFYLNEEHLQKGYPAVLEISDKAIENYEVEFLKKGIVARVYIGEYLPDRLVWDSNLKEVRIATEQERYDLDPVNYELREDLYYIKDGILKNIPSTDKSLAKPFFDKELEMWVEGAILDEVKEFKRVEFKTQRDLSTVQPFEYNGVFYQADLISQDKFFKSMMLNETNIYWIALDNTTHLLTHEDFTLIVEGLKEREKQSFVKFNTLYIQVLLCETIDEIKAIIW